MHRPPRPYMNNSFRGPRPYNQQFRPNHGPPAPFNWRPANHGHDNRKEYNEDHWCETCDRGFPTPDLLSKHKQQHQKCNIDGCQFIAHPKVITKHIQMQHSTGLYKKIANLNNPEEIQKWREERKKRYPTKSNIEKKAAERKEKIERGEKMFLNGGNRKERQNTADHRPGVKRRHGFDKPNQNQKPKRQNVDSSVPLSTNKPVKDKKQKVIPSIPAKVEKNKLKPFTGILNIVMDNEIEETIETTNCNDLIEEDYYEEPQKQVVVNTSSTQEPVLCGALTTLMCEYGSSDEETDSKQENVPSEIPTKTEPPLEIPQVIDSDKTKIESPVVEKHDKEIESKESDDDAPEEVKIVKTNVEHEIQEPAVRVKEKQSPPKKRTPFRNDRNQNHIRRKIPSTLLQKLLHNEMRKERNIVLQCIRHIIKNNYFDKTSQ